MFGRDRHDRGALVALIAALIAIVSVAYLNEPSGSIVAGQNSATVQNDAEEDVAQPVPGADDFNFWQDTFPQWVMAMFTIAATGVSILAVVYVRDTLRETRKAVKAAEDAVTVSREMGIKQTRSFVTIGTKQLSGYNDSFRAVFTVVNSGMTGAFNVSIRCTLHVYLKGKSVMYLSAWEKIGVMENGRRLEKVAIDFPCEAMGFPASLADDMDYHINVDACVVYGDVFDRTHTNFLRVGYFAAGEGRRNLVVLKSQEDTVCSHKGKRKSDH